MKKLTFTVILFITTSTLLFAPTQAADATLLTATTLNQKPPTISYTENEMIPVSFIEFVPCANDGAGEDVYLEGNLHVTMHITINGNNVTAKVHFQPQGISGTGAVSGYKYQATGVTQNREKGSMINGQFHFIMLNNFRIIGQKSGNNLLIHENFHISGNANGIITAFVDNFHSECR